MDEKVLKAITVLSVILAAVVCVSLYFFPDMHEKAVMAAEAKTDLLDQDQMTVVSKDENPEDIVKASEDGNAQLKIQIPQGLSEEEVSIENNYVTQTLYIRVDTEVDDYFSTYTISGKCNHIASLSYYKDKESGVIAIAMDKLCEVKNKIEGDNLYIDFVNPHDIYDKVIVIDAGHGGRAAGAVKQQIEEKEIDLKIVKELKKLFDESDENIGVYYTRLDDSNPTLDQRVQMANKSEADMFISIHNNANNNGYFSGLYGTQVMYSESDKGDLNSKRLSEIMLKCVCNELKSRKIGLLKGDEIYIIRTSEVPVALVEVGFMTNKEELEKLQDEEYQKAAAQGIYKGVLQAIEEGF